MRRMKFLVFSDLHGSKRGLEKLQAAVLIHKPDLLICLGDTLFGAMDGDARACADYLSHSSVPITAVRGNCDSYHDESTLGFPLPDEHTFYFAGHRLRLSHAAYWSDSKPGDILMSGHTHVQSLYRDGQTIRLNPGSIGKPRDGIYGYATIEEWGIALYDASDHHLVERLDF